MLHQAPLGVSAHVFACCRDGLAFVSPLCWSRQRPRIDALLVLIVLVAGQRA